MALILIVMVPVGVILLGILIAFYIDLRKSAKREAERSRRHEPTAAAAAAPGPDGWPLGTTLPAYVLRPSRNPADYLEYPVAHLYLPMNANDKHSDADGHAAEAVLEENPYGTAVYMSGNQLSSEEEATTTAATTSADSSMAIVVVVHSDEYIRAEESIEVSS